MKIIMLLLVLFTPLPISAADLSFQINNLENNNGQIKVALFSENEKESFPEKMAHATCTTMVQINKKTAEALCENVATGHYAEFVFHDENNNAVLDHNWFGLPQETFGYYKNFKVKFSPPDFDDVAFDITMQNQTFIINLQHFSL